MKMTKIHQLAGRSETLKCLKLRLPLSQAGHRHCSMAPKPGASVRTSPAPQATANHKDYQGNDLYPNMLETHRRLTADAHC